MATQSSADPKNQLAASKIKVARFLEPEAYAFHCNLGGTIDVVEPLLDVASEMHWPTGYKACHG